MKRNQISISNFRGEVPDLDSITNSTEGNQTEFKSDTPSIQDCCETMTSPISKVVYPFIFLNVKCTS